jgi:type VI secretion system protein ImpK
MSSQRRGQEQSSTWIHKGLATITRMGRGGAEPAAPPRETNPLREIFSDLVAFVILFRSSCDKQAPEQNEVREKVLALASAQEERAKAAGVSDSAFREARFAVFSWVDEMILTSAWPHRSRWQHLMLSYYNTFNAGEEFFQHLENLPAQAHDVREIYYLCLSLGFLGQHAFADGPREIAKLKHSLYRQLSGNKGDIRANYSRLFPEAYQKAFAEAPAPNRIRFIWYLVVLSAPVILFVVYFAILRFQSDQLTAKIPKTDQAPPPVPAPAVARSWSSSLVEELRRKGVRAVEEAQGVRITLETLLFTAGSAQLNNQARGKIDDIVTTVQRYAPDSLIMVEGHASRERDSDDTRNQRLSEERARAVADAFRALNFRNDRIFAQGFGSTRPLATNDTEQGRSQNRRVEIIVKK